MKHDRRKRKTDTERERELPCDEEGGRERESFRESGRAGTRLAQGLASCNIRIWVLLLTRVLVWYLLRFSVFIRIWVFYWSA